MDTWGGVRKHYLTAEYHTLFDAIDTHCTSYHTLPTFEDLKFSIRDANTREKLYSIEAVEVEADPDQLLLYVKNEYAQREILDRLENYVENSVAFENAEDSLAELHQMVMDVETLVEVENPKESMQRIQLFESEEEYKKMFKLGLNAEFDAQHQFLTRDLILVGGYRGSGKSITCSNLASDMFNIGRSSVTYSTEMDPRACLRRICSIGAGVSNTRLKNRNLNNAEWEEVARWWASRFADSTKVIEFYLEHRNFETFHEKLTKECELIPNRQIDIVYDPMLTIGKIQADLDKKLRSGMEIGVIIVDYLNKVKLHATPSRRGAYDWVEQLEVSTALKAIAATYEIPVFSPYQTKVDGEASFSKGILIDADAVYTLVRHKDEDQAMTFECTKMRDGKMLSFTSYMDWDTLKMGPSSAIDPRTVKKEKEDLKTGEPIEDPPF